MQTSSKLAAAQSNSFLKVVAKIISYLFHPLFIPTYVAIAVSYMNKSAFDGITMQQKMQYLYNIALNTIFFPLITTLLLKALGFISSIQMPTMKDRIIPLIGTMVFYFWAYLIMKNIQAPLILKVLTLGFFWGIVLVFMANIFIKVSMHTAGVGGMLGVVIVTMILSKYNLLPALVLVLMLGGIVGTARMILKAHQPFEVWLGYGLGIIAPIAAYFYLS
jgi:hypothetical protein